MLSIAALLCGSGKGQAGELLASGSGSFDFKDAKDRTITVWYYRPQMIGTHTEVLFVMHGVERNGQEYRDAWLEYAKSKHAVLLVPEFSEKFFPDAEQYNQGDVFSSSGQPNDKAQWTFTSIEKIFDLVKSSAGMKADGYMIYGHSAGAQFVSRMVLFMPDARIVKAVSANAGWYTMPTFDTDYPYGLKGSGLSEVELKKAFQRKYVVMLGDKDTDENHKHLNKSSGAMAQGKFRLERGKNFCKCAKQAASKMGVPLEWDLKIVPGVGHSNSGMAKAAVNVLF